MSRRDNSSTRIGLMFYVSIPTLVHSVLRGTDSFQVLAVAKAYDEIRVAEGTYKPDANSLEPGGSGDRNTTFQLVAVY